MASIKSLFYAIIKYFYNNTTAVSSLHGLSYSSRYKHDILGKSLTGFYTIFNREKKLGLQRERVVFGEQAQSELVLSLWPFMSRTNAIVYYKDSYTRHPSTLVCSNVRLITAANSPPVIALRLRQ